LKYLASAVSVKERAVRIEWGDLPLKTTRAWHIQRERESFGLKADNWDYVRKVLSKVSEFRRSY
jgi:hypothetical protein